MLAKKELEDRCRQAEDRAFKLKVESETTREEADGLAASNKGLTEQLKFAEKEMMSLKEALEVANAANSDHVSEFMEKIKGKDLIIDTMTNEARQLKATVKNQEASAAYFKRRIEELTT